MKDKKNSNLTLFGYDVGFVSGPQSKKDLVLTAARHIEWLLNRRGERLTTRQLEKELSYLYEETKEQRDSDHGLVEQDAACKVITLIQAID